MDIFTCVKFCKLQDLDVSCKEIFVKHFNVYMNICMNIKSMYEIFEFLIFALGSFQDQLPPMKIVKIPVLQTFQLLQSHFSPVTYSITNIGTVGFRTFLTLRIIDIHVNHTPNYMIHLIFEKNSIHFYATFY